MRAIEGRRTSTGRLLSYNGFTRSKARHPLADGKLGTRRHAVQAQFAHDVSAVGLDRLDADLEAVRDFLGILAFGDLDQHFPLPPRKDVAQPPSFSPAPKAVGDSG